MGSRPDGLARLRQATARVAGLPVARRSGKVVAVRGGRLEIAGLDGVADVGARLAIDHPGGARPAEIVGFEQGRAVSLAFCDTDGIGVGRDVRVEGAMPSIRPDLRWRGRMIDALGRPVDGRGPLPQGLVERPVKAAPPPAASRARLGGRVETGVRAIDLFSPICAGQRMGLFAASGVGKSVLLGMVARGGEFDLIVVGLVGERGREVGEFVADELGPDGVERSILVVATSDEPALMRRQAAWTAMAVAEHFRDAGLNVLLLMDSVTRFAMAQREIGLAGGEPPATKGYPPSCFAELPRLLERAGPGGPGCSGMITAVFTVLVDGDDHDEPIADAVRGILDGHIVLSRRIGERGRYPAIDLLRSLSRTVPRCLTAGEAALRSAALAALSVNEEMEELVRLGGYRPGTDPATDRALALAPALEALARQDRDEAGPCAEGWERLGAVIAAAEGLAA